MGPWVMHIWMYGSSILSSYLWSHLFVQIHSEQQEVCSCRFFFFMLTTNDMTKKLQKKCANIFWQNIFHMQLHASSFWKDGYNVIVLIFDINSFRVHLMDICVPIERCICKIDCFSFTRRETAYYPYLMNETIWKKSI